MLKNLTLLMLLVSLGGCCGLNTQVTYTYNGIEVIRIDKCGETSFYYKKLDHQIPGKIIARYSGINSGFSGYLLFKNNGRVEVLSGDGYFISDNIDSSKFAYKRILAYQRPSLGDSVYLVMLSTRYEIERNAISGTKVKAEYKVDDNEWW
jgi:hypothetical protein